MHCGVTISSAARSAIVRATLRTLKYLRADSCRRAEASSSALRAAGAIGILEISAELSLALSF